MKKSLIALAAVAASGAAFAQSSVVLSGTVDTSIGYVKGEDSVQGLLKGGNATSKLVFRGVEDLGNGLKAEFVLDSAVGSDDGGSAMDFKRQSTVGLIGSFGQVRLGRAQTQSYVAVSRYDVFGTVGVGASRMWSTGFKATAQDLGAATNGFVTGSVDLGAYDNRASNMLTYISPDFAGFKVGVDYAFGEQKENRDGRYWGVGLSYDNGPLSLGLGYERANGKPASLTDATTGDFINTAADLKTWHLGGSYNFGVAKLTAAYKQQTNDVAAEWDLAGDTGSVSGDAKIKSYLIGVSAPVGAAGEVKASYNNYKLEDAKTQQFSLGYVHNLSKRTAVYGTYAFMKHDKNGGVVTMGGDAFSAAGLGVAGEKDHGFQVGIRHNF